MTAQPTAGDDGDPTDYSRPLAGITVLDLGQIYNVPYATLLLALAGAEVIKIEPLSGEISRKRQQVNVGAGVAFYMLNSNKRGVTLNLKDPRGRELFLDLTDRATVVVENFRPGVMDRLGLGAKELLARWPGLIYASGSGYGQDGRYRDLPAMDLTIQAMTGVIASTGFPDGNPVKAGPALSDFLGGIHLYGAVTTALYRLARTGQGAHVDVAMMDSVYPTMMSNAGPFIGAALGTGPAPPERTGNRQGGLAESPYNVYPTKDGHLSIVCLDDDHWEALLKAIGWDDLVGTPRYATKAARILVMDEVDALITQWTLTRTTDEAFRLLRQSGAVCAPARSLGSVIRDPYFRERGLISDQEVSGVGVLPLLHSPLHFAEEARLPIQQAPGLGADNDYVYGEWLGRSAEELAELRADGVI